MGNPQEQGAHQPETQIDEQDNWQPKGEDKIREEIISEYGFDPDEETEKIDKLVAAEVAHQSELSKAIKQKRDWREKAQKGEKPVEPAEKKSEPITDDLLDSKLDEREISRLEASDAIKEQVRQFKKLNPSVSVQAALNSRYVQSFIQEEAEQKRADEASIGSGSSGQTKISYSDIANPEDLADKFDMTTEKGIADYEKALAAWEKAQKFE